MMKLRHAGALALMGWYLMAAHSPSPNDSYWTQLHDHLFGPSVGPLSEWKIMAAFDSAEKCEAQRDSDVGAGVFKKYPQDAEKGPNIDAPSAERDLREADDLKSRLICVATDDPRLKGK